VADLAAAFQHERIGVDTPIFISHIAGTTHLAGEALDELAGGAFTGVTSVLTLMALAARRLHIRRPDVAEEYEVLLANDPNLVIAALDRLASRRAAELRAECRLRPAGAWQVAACREQGATASLSNDRDLRRLTDLPVWMLEDFV
jgi:predicted nucleic acid-binding protein